MERSAGLLERHARRGEDFPHAGAVAVQLDVKLVERSSEADELILWVDHCIVGEKKKESIVSTCRLGGGGC